MSLACIAALRAIHGQRPVNVKKYTRTIHFFFSSAKETESTSLCT